MTRSRDPSASQIALLKELFEAHLAPIREDVKALRADSSISSAAIRADMSVNREKLDDVIHRVVAHDGRLNEHDTRMEKYETRFWAWVCGVGGLGAAGGVSMGDGARQLIKAIFS